MVRLQGDVRLSPVMPAADGFVITASNSKGMVDFVFPVKDRADEAYRVLRRMLGSDGGDLRFPERTA